MAETDLSVALTCLRVIRGWTRDELGRASGLPKNAVSDYERGRKVPDLETVDRLLAAMGYPISALHQVRKLVRSMSPVEALGWISEWPSPEAPPGSKYENASRGDLHWEVHQLAAEAGKAVNRLAQLTLVLMSRAMPISIVTNDDGD